LLAQAWKPDMIGSARRKPKGRLLLRVNLPCLWPPLKRNPPNPPPPMKEAKPMSNEAKHGKRAKRLKRLGIYEEVMWHEGYREEREGQFKQEREALETESLERVFDRWLRGQNLSGFSAIILRRVEQLKKVTKRAATTQPTP
jgi:hypothetical protein